MASVTAQIRAVRDAERRLRELPAARRTADVMAALPTLERQEQRLGQTAVMLRRRAARATAYAHLLTDQRRNRAALADVAIALTELRRLPPRSSTPYLRSATRELLDRDTTLRHEQTAIARAITRLQYQLAARLEPPLVRPSP